MRVFLGEGMSHIVSQRTTYARYLEAMGESVVYENTTWEGEYLSFVLQTTKRSREYQSVIVALELSAVILMYVVGSFQSQSFV
jgi:hypothetical protein